MRDVPFKQILYGTPVENSAPFEALFGVGRSRRNTSAGIGAGMAPEEVCAVSGCGKEAARSLPTKKVTQVLDGVSLTTNARRSHLCRDHYRQFRKKTKQERQLERLGW